jgi:hypothetical protein
MSTRTLTKEQFSSGTNIDGNRIDKALGDLQDRINNVPLSDIKTSYIPYQIVGGFSPTRAQFIRMPYSGSAIRSPNDPFTPDGTIHETTGIDCWLPATHTFENNEYKENAALPSYDNIKKENPITVKGSLRDTTYYDSTGANQYRRNYVMTNAYTTTSPIIIDEVSVWIASNVFYPNSFRTIGTNGPSWWGVNNVTNKSLGDLQFFITVDDDDLSESVQLRTTEWGKQDFHIWSGRITNNPGNPGAPLTSSYGTPLMTAQTSSMGRTGSVDLTPSDRCLFFIFKDLKISVPENGRWRFSVLIPDYQKDSTAISGSTWTERPDFSEMTWSITGLEEIKV